MYLTRHVVSFSVMTVCINKMYLKCFQAHYESQPLKGIAAAGKGLDGNDFVPKANSLSFTLPLFLFLSRPTSTVSLFLQLAGSLRDIPRGSLPL